MRASTLKIQGTAIAVSGRLLRTATVEDEDWLPESAIADPRAIVSALQANSRKVDLFTFSQKLPDIEPRYPFSYEWDNVAAIRTDKYDEWWQELPQEARKNCRRAARRGVELRTFQLDDQAVRGIQAIYNEVPTRQGRPFAHYGKDLETVRREAATLADRSLFIGAYFQQELIGFIRLVFMGPIASILNICSMNTHYDKRPANALIVAAAEICRDREVSYLLYGKYIYGRKLNSPLTEFKKRTGFRQIAVPRYYVPFTLRARVFMMVGLHRRLIDFLPPSVIDVLVVARNSILRHARSPAKS